MIFYKKHEKSLGNDKQIFEENLLKKKKKDKITYLQTQNIQKLYCNIHDTYL